MKLLRPLALAGTGLAVCAALLLAPTAAEAHSLDSSTISVHETGASVDATISIALATLDDALGTDYASSTSLDATAVERIGDYLDEHLTVTGSDGAVWEDTVTSVTTESVDGLESVVIEVRFDSANGAASDTSGFTIDYDAVIDTDPGHEAVVVLTDAAGDVSTAGIITADDSTLAIGDAVAPGLADMIGLGYQHVLEGADHLLFLITLLLAAPLIVVANRWRRGPSFLPSAGKVVRIVTAFTAGHSLTLIASALGWVSLPAAFVEVLVAASVAVSALHAMRPIVRNGEVLIAGSFGLVHGLAFAGILADLGLSGSLSIWTLLAFNVGVELAQLVTVALVFPSLYLISRTRFGSPFRIAAAGFALLAALAWIVERLGVLANPFATVEETVIAYPLAVVAGLALVAVVAWVVDRRRGPGVGDLPSTRRVALDTRRGAQDHRLAAREQSTAGHG